jgi:ArsR family transcriptional regulator
MKNEYIRVFRAFTDESRVRVLEMLRDGEQCACILLDGLKISQPTLSHHMKILCESGIVKSRRAGQWHYYSIDTDGCEHASRLLRTIAGRELDKTLAFMGAVYRFLRVITGRSLAEAVRAAAPGARCCRSE